MEDEEARMGCHQPPIHPLRPRETLSPGTERGKANVMRASLRSSLAPPVYWPDPGLGLNTLQTGRGVIL